VRIDGSLSSTAASVLRYFVNCTGDRLLVVNPSRDLRLDPISEPLLAPPDGATRWAAVWSSEEPTYGGHGTAPIDTDDGWLIPGESAAWLAGEPAA